MTTITEPTLNGSWFESRLTRGGVVLSTSYGKTEEECRANAKDAQRGREAAASNSLLNAVVLARLAKTASATERLALRQMAAKQRQLAKR